MIKRLLVTLLLIFLVSVVDAQPLSFYGNIGLNKGFHNSRMAYNGGSTGFGYGSGMGISLGLQYDSNLPIFLYGGAAFNFAAALQYESYNGVSNKSSFKFNYKSISLGIGKMILLNDVAFIHAFRLHGGVDYNFPSFARQIEDNQNNGRINYQNNLGFQLGGKLSLQIKQIWFIEPGITFHRANFTYKNYNWNADNGKPSSFMLNPNASHLELSLSLRKKIGNAK